MIQPELVCRTTVSNDEEVVHHRIRHEVFVLEQAVFAGSDRDERDAAPGTIKVLGFADEVPAGAVRLYPLDAADRLWQGDRLAVLPPYRACALGRLLVRFAVATAADLGGREMVAHVQVANVRFFERLGWECRGDPEVYVGLPHQLMTIDLTAVPVPVVDLRAPHLPASAAP